MPAIRTLLALLLLPAALHAQQKKISFRTQVWPILQKSCLECHKAPHKGNDGQIKNPKGGLRIDGPSGLLKGGSDGPGVEPGDADKSGIYSRILLPPDHEDAMPPKGKGKPLTFDESEIIKNWILEGADFADWKGSDTTVAVQPAPGGKKPSADPLAAGTTVAPAEAIKKIEALGALVGPVAVGNPLLRVEWVSGASLVTDKEVALLAPLAGNITELDLSDTKITDESLKVIAKMPKLTWLALNNTQVGDTGMEELKALQHLAWLNLHSTQVSDSGLSSLSGLKKLRRVYAWKSRITSTGAAAAQKATPELKVTLE